MILGRTDSSVRPFALNRRHWKSRMIRFEPRIEFFVPAVRMLSSELHEVVPKFLVPARNRGLLSPDVWLSQTAL